MWRIPITHRIEIEPWQTTVMVNNADGDPRKLVRDTKMWSIDVLMRYRSKKGLVPRQKRCNNKNHKLKALNAMATIPEKLISVQDSDSKIEYY